MASYLFRFATPRLTQAVLGLVLWSGLSGAEAQVVYPEDLARRLATPAEIREVTNIRARFRKESRESETVFVFTPLPFAEILAVPDSSPKSTKRPKQWSLPPFASIDPALSPDLPESNRLEIENRRRESVVPGIWSELALTGQDLDKPSVLLVPRPFQPGEEIVVEVTEIPDPFSVRRYYENDKNIFIELAAFGGTTSFRAEEAYKAMKQSAVEQEPMQGFGEEAFLARVLVIDEASRPDPEEPSIDGPPLPEAPPFPELAPEGRARPELIDSARAAALTAPAFNDLAVVDLEGKSVRYPTPPKKYVPKGGKVKQSLIVLVAYYPDEALTLRFAIEERLGTVQDLMAVALHAQRNLREKF